MDGFNFDFRARGNNWSFEVVDPNNENEVIEPLWRIERRYGETPFSAGWMPQAEALVFILDAANLFREAQRDIVAP